jgi:hypothetical protein
MAQTKRKRRNKHRGNAVGAVEARGRTSKPQPSAKNASRGKGARAGREVKPPSWNSAALKAGTGAVLLFLLARFGVLGNEQSTAQALLLAGIALLFYTPIMYLTDRWIYRRKQAAGSTTRR